MVDKRKRNKSMAEAARRELKRVRFLQALKKTAGAWKDADHPELVEKGAYRWVRELREGENRRCC